QPAVPGEQRQQQAQRRFGQEAPPPHAAQVSRLLLTGGATPHPPAPLSHQGRGGGRSGHGARAGHIPLPLGGGGTGDAGYVRRLRLLPSPLVGATRNTASVAGLGVRGTLLCHWPHPAQDSALSTSLAGPRRYSPRGRTLNWVPLAAPSCAARARVATRAVSSEVKQGMRRSTAARRSSSPSRRGPRAVERVFRTAWTAPSRITSLQVG